MSQLQDCSNPCPTIAPVNVPGTAGQSAFTYTTSSFQVPALQFSNVSVQVLSTTPFFVGEIVAIQVTPSFVATFSVNAINSATLMTLTWLAYLNDVAGATSVPSGALVVNIGRAGIAGTSGAAGYATVLGAFTGGSSTGQLSTVSVSNAALLPINATVVIANAAGNFQTFTVTAANLVANTVTIEWLNSVGDTGGSSFAIGNLVLISTTPGLSTFSVTTGAATPNFIPAIGSSQTFNVNSTAWMMAGAIVVTVANGLPAHYQVTTISSPTSVVLTFLGYYGDVAGGSTNFVATGSVITPSGTQPYSAVAAYVQTGATAPLSSTTGAALTWSGGLTPSVILTPGTWLINASVAIGRFTQSGTAGAIFVYLYDTVGSVALGNGGVFMNIAASAVTSTDLVLPLPPILYRVALNSTIVFYGYQTNPSGTVANAVNAAILAHRIA